MKRFKSWNKTVIFLGALLVSLSVWFPAWSNSSCKDLVLKDLRGRGFQPENIFQGFVVESPAMWDVLQTILYIPDGVAVLIVGETGVGKEHVARLIHDISSRRGKPYVVLDSGALSKDLVLSTLFGHEKGAFTGAHRTQAGLLSEANQGTFFLDEVVSLPRDVQHHFIRVLEEKVFRPLGRNDEVRADFRLIAATNKSPEDMIEQGFREDLYHRLAEFVLRIPPLRERVSDIPVLANHFLKQFGGDLVFSEHAVNKLFQHSWPGNVRELRHVVIQSVVNARRRMSMGVGGLKEILPEDVELGDVGSPVNLEEVVATLLRTMPQLPNFRELPQQVRRLLIQEALRRTETNGEAAAMLGMNRTSLQRMMRDWPTPPETGTEPTY